MKNNPLYEHFLNYPKLEIQDVFKYIYQSAFGCEHMVSSEKEVKERIVTEYNDGVKDNTPFTALDGKYSRVHLSYLDRGLSPDTLAKLFTASAKKEEQGSQRLLAMLCEVKEIAAQGLLPFDIAEFEAAEQAWADKGYAPVHHSQSFRDNYKPAYRVISNRFIPFLPLFARVDKMLEKGNVILALEGGSASGKSTLGDILKMLYDCNLFHMDDFFLRPEQRTAARYSEPGGNVDRERFLSEVLVFVKQGEAVKYRPFNCAKMQLDEPVCVLPKKLTVIEGAYSMHPELSGYYDLSAFLEIAPDLQKQRIIKRNGAVMAKNFFEKWIPLERTYFEKLNVKERCDICIIV